MYMTDILVAIVSITNLASCLITIYLIRSIARTATPDAHVEELVGYDEQVSIQEHILQREEQFNARISQMKADLDKPDQAQELHPDVHNLPHNIIHGGTQIVETSE